MINKESDKQLAATSDAVFFDAKIQFSESDIKAFIELGKTLKRIHTRLIMEGYTIESGRIYKP